MCVIKRIDKREKTEKYYKLLQEDESSLPFFLYEDPRYVPIAVRYQKGKIFAGLACGLMQEGDSNFYLHYLRLSAAATDKRDVIRFSEQLFSFVRDEYKAERIVMNIEQADDSIPVYVKLLKEAPNIDLEKLTFYRQVGVATKDFEHFRQFHWYCPALMEKKGYEAIPVNECQGTWRRKLQEREQRGEIPSDYLSPGMWEDSWVYDPDTSYVLVRKGTDNPIGWIVTERVSENMVKLRRFYIYDEARRLCLGPSFSTWVLEKIEERYEKLWFEVEKGNRQMEMFTNCYCKPIMTFDFFKCQLIIKQKGGQDNGLDAGET